MAIEIPAGRGGRRRLTPADHLIVTPNRLSTQRPCSILQGSDAFVAAWVRWIWCPDWVDPLGTLHQGYTVQAIGVLACFERQRLERQVDPGPPDDLASQLTFLNGERPLVPEVAACDFRAVLRPCNQSDDHQGEEPDQEPAYPWHPNSAHLLTALNAW